MRRDVLELRQFYASRLGQAVRVMTARKVIETWGDAHGQDVLGLGYATPFLGDLTPTARRVVAAMPAQQGVEIWPAGEPNRVCLSGEDTLPFRNALFDRILAVHALEESPDPLALLREVWRVLAPSGRVVVVVAARNGLWANSETTPFGHGRPYSRSQLAELLREAELEPSGWTRAGRGLTAKVCFTASTRTRPAKPGQSREPACSNPSAQPAIQSTGGAYSARVQPEGSSSASRSSSASWLRL
jgi:SAM-dependent methyltransferase